VSEGWCGATAGSAEDFEEHEAAGNPSTEMYCSSDDSLKYWPPFGWTFCGVHK
jgi:hypothetical protein